MIEEAVRIADKLKSGAVWTAEEVEKIMKKIADRIESLGTESKAWKK